MWRPRVFAGYKGPAPAFLSALSTRANGRKLAPRIASSPQQDHEREKKPPVPDPSTTANHRREREMPSRKRNAHLRPPAGPAGENAESQSATAIPGLTLLNNGGAQTGGATPRAGRPNGNGFTAANQPSPAAPAPVKRGRKSKYALRKEAEALAAAQRAQMPPPPPPPTRPRRGSNNSNNTTTTNQANGSRKQRPSPDAQDGRQVPSKESGGVPDPTALYLVQSAAPPILLSQPRRILVIMDLNGTLLFRPNKRNPFHFIERPHARSFLNYCIDTFNVAIWSSARPENVNKMVAQLLTPDQRARCVVIWARNKFGLSPDDYDSRVQCYKRLTTIWADPTVMASHPGHARGRVWDQTNTVLVDDSIEKGRSEPYNILQIPEFAGLQNEPNYVLPQVHDYLNSLCYQADVSRYMRQDPFRINSQYRLEAE